MPLPRLPDLQKLPFRLQVATVAGVLVLLGIGGYAGLVMPKTREIKTLRAQLLRGEPDPLPAQQFAPITEEERRLWGELETRLRKRFPAEKDLPGAIEAVADLARFARMELLSLNLEPPPPKGPPTRGTTAAPPPPALRVPSPLTVSPTAIKLTAIHRYRDLVQFLDGLPRLPVAVAVESMEVKRQDGTLTTEITLRTLRWGTS